MANCMVQSRDHIEENYVRKHILIIAMLLLTLFGCVHYEEELWLNRDGSGKAKLILIHRSANENPDEILKKAELNGIHLQSYSIKRNGPNVIYNVQFKFDSIEAFNNVNDQVGNADFWGKITLNKEKGRRITFKRRISLGDQEEVDDFEMLLRSTITDHPTWSYKVHLPWKIISTNADEANVDRKGRTITWNYDTEQLWNKTEYMTIELEKPFPWLLVVLGGIIGILVIFSLFWLMRIARSSHLLDWMHHKNSDS